MTDEPLVLINHQHPVTQYWTILEDDRISAWVYITKSNSFEPITDCFVYNRVPPIDKSELNQFSEKQQPPPITTDYATASSYQPLIQENEVMLVWNNEGSGAMVLIRYEPACFLLVTEQRGYSKGISKSGPFGEPWNQELFERYFER